MVTMELRDIDNRQRIRKRPRLTWNVVASHHYLQPPEAAARLPVDSGIEGFARPLSPPRRDDDRDGHYVYRIGENLSPRYRIISQMGEGTFGRVLECLDYETRELVAIKVVRSIRKYRDAAMIEIDVLQHLAKYDRGNLRCVQIRNWFDYRNHICIVSFLIGFFSADVFEKLGPSLYDFLRRNKYYPFPVDLVQEFGRQLLESVAYMHDLLLVHTDLKPENILLVSSETVTLPGCKRNSRGEIQVRHLPKSSAIKLIDFGSTVHGNQSHSSTVSTRHYRAPEIILGLGWSYPCDLWSVGCILIELCLGHVLFQTHENLEHMAMMERVLGPMPAHMIQSANCGNEKYFRRGQLNWPEGAVSRESIRAVRKLDQLEDLVSRYVGYSNSSLTNLLRGLLRFEPSERLTAHEALNHPFFKNPSCEIRPRRTYIL